MESTLHNYPWCLVCGKELRRVDSTFCDRECRNAWVDDLNNLGYSLEYRAFMTDEGE